MPAHDADPLSIAGLAIGTHVLDTQPPSAATNGRLKGGVATGEPTGGTRLIIDITGVSVAMCTIRANGAKRMMGTRPGTKMIVR